MVVVVVVVVVGVEVVVVVVVTIYYSTTADSSRDQVSNFIRDGHVSKSHVKPFTNSDA